MTTTIIPDETMTDDEALAVIERTHRPAWASEGEYDDDAVFYRRVMTHGTVYIDQFLTRTPLDWRFLVPADINVAEHEAVSPERAKLIIEDVAEAIAILESVAPVQDEWVDIYQLGKLAPGTRVADVLRLAHASESGASRWRVAEVQAFLAGNEEAGQ